MSSRDIPVARTSRALSKSDPEEYGLLDDLLFQPLTRRDRIASFVGHALQDEPDSFRLKLIDALAALTPEDWAVLAKMARRVESEWKSKKDQAGAQSSQEESISEND